MTQPKFSLHALAEFLDGSAPLDGVWFGERHVGEGGVYWWRKHLRAAMDADRARELDAEKGGERKVPGPDDDWCTACGYAIPDLSATPPAQAAEAVEIDVEDYLRALDFLWRELSETNYRLYRRFADFLPQDTASAAIAAMRAGE